MLMDIGLVSKDIIAFRLLSEDSIKFIKYIELLKYHNIYYLFFKRIKADVNKIV